MAFRFLQHSFPISVTSPLVRLTDSCQVEWLASAAAMSEQPLVSQDQPDGESRATFRL